jgi:WD40 repeat protein
MPDNLGYTLVNYKLKQPMASITIDVDSIRQVALSPDGSTLAFVKMDSKVVLIYKLEYPTNTSAEHELKSFVLSGTVLSADPDSLVDAVTSCQFARSNNFIITDGGLDSILVWDAFNLGDHATLSFKSAIPNLPQIMVPIYKSKSSPPIGWAITEGSMKISFIEVEGRNCVKSIQLESRPPVVSTGLDSVFASGDDIIVGIDSSPDRRMS